MHFARKIRLAGFQLSTHHHAKKSFVTVCQAKQMPIIE
jgi:hypothetical protein